MPDFELWLEFEVWRGEGGTDDPLDDSFNMKITLPDGDRYALNVWTFRYFARALAESKKDGEHLGGRYLPAPDLFVERMDRESLEAVVADLITHDGLRKEWLVVDDG